jgi:hypothetical protein
MSSAMSKEPTKPAVKSVSIQEEVYLRLIEAVANQEAFNLGRLRDANQCQDIAKHLRGVSEIIASVWENK